MRSSGRDHGVGMVGCVVRDHTVSAVTDMPGVLAIFLKRGACLFWRNCLRSEGIVAKRAELSGRKPNLCEHRQSAS